MLDTVGASVYAAPMNTHTDHTDYLDVELPRRAEAEELGMAPVLPPRIPEWRRRSMEGRGRFDAVTDTTGLVAL
jgi:hypothetical protein